VGALVGGCSFPGEKEPALTNWEPALSPDGSRLVFETAVNRHLDLFVRDLETGATVRLTQNEDEDWSPTWSPDATRIAFASNRDKNNDIYVLDLATQAVVRLTADAGDDINPTWGNDNRVYFNSNRSGVWEIYSVGPDGTDLTKVTETSNDRE
jgi:Tol biopolymer transport system component